MIHLIAVCSWCDTKVDLEASFATYIDLADDNFIIYEHEGEPFLFCSKDCLTKACESQGWTPDQ